MPRSIRPLILLVTAVVLAACGTDPTTIVRQGTLSMDKTVTVGNALGNYRYFKEKSWKNFEDEQKRKIVEFTGTFNMDECAAAMAKAGIGDAEIRKFANIKAKDIHFTYTAQFALHQDGKSFELKYSGVSGTNVAGEPFTAADRDLGILKQIYQNELPLDLSAAFVTLESGLMAQAEKAAAPIQPPAAPQAPAPGVDPCSNAGSNAEIVACKAQRFAKADAELNTLYKQLQASLPPERKAQLKKEQIAWIKEKERRCAPDPNGGTLANVTSLSCRIDMTEQRILQLKNYPK